MESGAPAAVGNVDAAQQRDDDLGALNGVIGCGHVQRRLPVLVPGVDVSRVVEQDANHFLHGNALNS